MCYDWHIGSLSCPLSHYEIELICAMYQLVLNINNLYSYTIFIFTREMALIVTMAHLICSLEKMTFIIWECSINGISIKEQIIIRIHAVWLTELLVIFGRHCQIIKLYLYLFPTFARELLTFIRKKENYRCCKGKVSGLVLKNQTLFVEINDIEQVAE